MDNLLVRQQYDYSLNFESKVHEQSSILSREITWIPKLSKYIFKSLNSSEGVIRILNSQDASFRFPNLSRCVISALNSQGEFFISLKIAIN
jgi:hypothetical protein